MAGDPSLRHGSQAEKSQRLLTVGGDLIELLERIRSKMGRIRSRRGRMRRNISRGRVQGSPVNNISATLPDHPTTCSQTRG